MTENYFRDRSVSAIASRLILTRKALGLNQLQFGKRAGIPDNTYNQYEKARGRPSLDFAFRLCDTYGLTLDWIYFGDPSKLPYDLAMAIAEAEKAENKESDPSNLSIQE